MLKKTLVGILSGAVILASATPAFAKVERHQDWKLNAPEGITFTCGGGAYQHTLNSVTNHDDNFSGLGTYNADHSYTWTFNGSTDDNDIKFTLVYTGSNPGYTLHGIGTINSDGSIHGTTDGNCQTFDMGAGSAFHYKNHGQYVRNSDDKREAAHSDEGKPENSHGHDNHSDD